VGHATISASLVCVPSAEESLDQLYDALSLLARGRRLGRLEERITGLAGARIDPPGRLLLRRIGEEGQVRLGELAGLLGLDPSTVSRKVQQLEQAGLIARTSDRRDKRAAVLSVTTEGKRLLRRFDTARRKLLGEVLANWSVADRLALASLLRRLASDFARHNRSRAAADTARASAPSKRSGARRSADEGASVRR
jgi:DNA-binding MarR family transcriptional regulator